MIDIHAHILPGVDDGPVDDAESLAMAALAVSGGTTDMICTSHSAEWFEIGPLPVMKGQIAALQSKLDAAGLGLRLYPGMEIFLTPETPRHLAEGRAWTLAGSRYVLVEIPYQPWPPYTEQTLFRLQVEGYTPVLAHPERYVAIQHDPDVMYRLAERGILGQVTTGAFEGHFGAATKRCAITLTERGLVQFLASDSHSATDHRRLPGLSVVHATLVRLIGAEAADAIASTLPARVLADEPITPDPKLAATGHSFFGRRS
ncbi:MAG: tyrosine-protein phosphatase [Chloroflexia bacterium]